MTHAAATPGPTPAPDQGGSFVVSLFKKSGTVDARGRSGRDGIRPQTRRRRWLALSFVLCVALPVALGSWYYGTVASDRYVSGAGFAIRGMEGGGGMDVVGAFTGLASTGSTTSDSYIVLKYLNSRDIIELLSRDFPLRRTFGAAEVDPLSRLATGASIEDVVEYWQGMIQTSFDPSTGVIEFDVQAFSAEDAHVVAGNVLGYVRDLVNRLSEDARQDAVRYAETEVGRAEERLKAAMRDVRTFRDAERSIDPNASAQLQMELLGGLEKQLLDVRARISRFEGRVNDDAPQLQSLRRQERVLRAQIAGKTEAASLDRDTGEQRTALSGLLGQYETLEVEKTFAQQAYASALSSLEGARAEADRQQRYLAVFSTPSLPENALYPRRPLNIAMILLGALCFWSIGTLIVYSVRDHLS